MNRNSLWAIDWKLFIPVLVLLIISLTTLFTLNYAFFKSQLIFSVVSVFIFLFFSNVNYKILKSYDFSIYIASLVFLGIVLILGIESRGSLRWIEIFGFRIQFSEIFKPFLAVSLASFLADCKNIGFSTLLKIFILLTPVVFLIFLQPDLGNALIYVGVVLLTLIYFGFPIKFFLAGLVIVVGIIPFFWKALHDYQKQRILTFLNPGNDPLGGSYNAIQSIIAVGSGMFFGKGLGLGTQSGLRFLPERHTDFIFATISEELGFVGSVIILVSFIFIFYRIISILKGCDDAFSKTLCAILFFIILIQVFVNIGMNIGILPVVGVTLPFVSYGGSSLLANFILLGLLSAVAKKTKETDVLEIR